MVENVIKDLASCKVAWLAQWNFLNDATLQEAEPMKSFSEVDLLSGGRLPVEKSKRIEKNYQKIKAETTILQESFLSRT